MFQFLNNIPPVTKNLLFINVLLFIITAAFANQIDLISLLGAHYVNSPLFEPYQIVTHFFMHSITKITEINGQPVESLDIFHILFNMFGLVVFGGLLERVWGAKRFFVFYIACAIGAFALYNLVGAYDIWQLQQKLTQLGYSVPDLNHALVKGIPFNYNIEDGLVINRYVEKSLTPVLGASGAIFGIMAAYAYLFPNTEMRMLFIPFPIKTKYLIGGYFVIELYLSFTKAGDHIAHLAHVGGAVVGFIIVYLWNRNRKTFY